MKGMPPNMWRMVDAAADLPLQPASSKILDIRFPDSHRVRKVVTRSRARMTGKYPSWKLARMVQWESRHEQNAFRLLDCDTNVRSYQEQPCKIVYWDGERERVHVPDLLVEFADRREIWEIKENGTLPPEVLLRTQIMLGLNAYGYAYKLISGEDLAAEPRLGTACTLLRWGNRPISPVEREALRRHMLKARQLAWPSQQSGIFGKQIVARATLEGLLFVQRFATANELVFELKEAA